MRLAAGVRPDPLERSPDPLAAIGERVLLLREREERGGEKKRKGRKREEKEEKRAGDGKCRGLPRLYLTSGYGPATRQQFSLVQLNTYC